MASTDNNPDAFNPEEIEDSASPEQLSPDDQIELEKLRAERNDLYQRLARLTADFKNSQKRLEADKDQAVQFSNSSLIRAMLPIIDNFERVLAQDPAKVDSQAIFKGMQIVHDQWLAELRKQHVDEIAPKAGEGFDPNLHQAVMQQDSDQYTEPTVMQLLTKGYRHHDRVLRPALVAVSKQT